MNPYTTYIAGIKYNEGKDVIPALPIGTKLRLVREPNNPYDPDAVAVYYGNYMLGHIPAMDVSRIASVFDKGGCVCAELTRTGVEKRIPTATIRVFECDATYFSQTINKLVSIAATPKTYVELPKSKGCFGVILLAFFFLTLSAISALAQAPEPFKKANIVLVTFDTMSVNSAFNVTGRTLLDLGFTINKSDKNFQTIETNVRKYAGSFNVAPISLIIRVSINSVNKARTEVKLSGIFGIGLNDPSIEVVYRGMKGSAFMVAFEKLQEVAKKLEMVSASKTTYTFQ